MIVLGEFENYSGRVQGINQTHVNENHNIQNKDWFKSPIQIEHSKFGIGFTGQHLQML